MLVETSKGNFIIREGTIDDLPQLVEVHVTSWNATYPYYHPKPSRELRTIQWKKLFNERPGEWFCYVAEKERGGIVGFATGSAYDGELDYDAELNKIHFYKDYHRLGLGTLLMQRVVQRFLEKGYKSMILFADPGNQNIVFYEKLGGERILDKEGKFHGAYGWKELGRLG
ncbi:MAG TPA: GNAT family N-acetyltransferase [Chitinophagaceae bacterium]